MTPSEETIAKISEQLAQLDRRQSFGQSLGVCRLIEQLARALSTRGFFASAEVPIPKLGNLCWFWDRAKQTGEFLVIVEDKGSIALHQAPDNWIVAALDHLPELLQQLLVAQERASKMLQDAYPSVRDLVAACTPASMLCSPPRPELGLTPSQQRAIDERLGYANSASCAAAEADGQALVARSLRNHANSGSSPLDTFVHQTIDTALSSTREGYGD